MKLHHLFEKQLLDDLEREYPNAALVANETPPTKVNFLVTDIPGNLTNTQLRDLWEKTVDIYPELKHMMFSYCSWNDSARKWSDGIVISTHNDTIRRHLNKYPPSVVSWTQFVKFLHTQSGDDFATINESREFCKLKKHKKPLTDEERHECLDKEAVWHHGHKGAPSPAVWKSVNPKSGKITYVTNTHRAYNTATTLSAAINKYHSFIKGTA